jgi:hypothetical protein
MSPWRSFRLAEEKDIFNITILKSHAELVSASPSK